MARFAFRRDSLGRVRRSPVAWPWVTQGAFWDMRKVTAIAASADLPE
jgi:hypothetical protein